MRMILALVLWGTLVPSQAFSIEHDRPGQAVTLSASTALAQQPAGADLKIDVDVHRGGGAWYTNPVWIAIGGLAVLLVSVLLVVAFRGGGGTTIVRD